MRRKPMLQLEILRVAAGLLVAGSAPTALRPDPAPALLDAVSLDVPEFDARLLDAAVSAAPAQDDADRWKWRVTPYLYGAALGGELSTGTLTVESEVGFSELFEDLDVGAFLSFEGQRGQFGFMLDGGFIDLSREGEGVVPSEASVEMTIAEAMATWRLTPMSPFALVCGARYLELQQELVVGGVSDQGRSEFLDVFAGGRAELPMGESWHLNLYADIGGGDADRTWQAQANIGYDFGVCGLSLGYRYLAYDFDDGAQEADVALEGLLLGLEFRF